VKASYSQYPKTGDNSNTSREKQRRSDIFVWWNTTHNYANKKTTG
jgi:hypothetical protein